MAKKKTTKSKGSSKKAKLSFEEALEKLRAAVTELENGDLTLTESLEQYEHGIGSLKECYAALNEAQRKIELLVGMDEEGNLKTGEFDSAATYQDGGLHDEDEDEGEQFEDEGDSLF